METLVPRTGSRRQAIVMRPRRVHRHRLDPDLSAYVAAPCCGCGGFLWEQALPTGDGRRDGVTATRDN